MARPKGYNRDSVVIAARDLFWERGYQAASLSDLEERTGLNRSSLYQEFGSKHALLDAALSCYSKDVVAALLADLHAPAANLDAITAFFARLAELLGSTTLPAKHGCLLVNTIAALAAPDSNVKAAAADYHTQLHDAFTAALTSAGQLGEIDPDTATTRADLLAALLLGTWLTTRIDTNSAIELCHTIIDEIDTWRIRKRGAGMQPPRLPNPPSTR